jgi:hypothetical protein
MFHKQYYKLDEAAQKLGVDIDFMAQSKGLFKKSFANDTYDSWYIFAENESAPICLPSKSIIPNELSIGNYESIDDFTINGITSFMVCNNDINNWECDTYECRPMDLLRVISHQELTRLLALKAQLEGKPTLEQVQAENEALKQQLDALRNSTTQSKQQQRELILSGWVSGKGIETARRMKQADIHEELKSVNRLFHIAESTFEDFWQAQKLIKLDTGKR